MTKYLLLMFVVSCNKAIATSQTPPSHTMLCQPINNYWSRCENDEVICYGAGNYGAISCRFKLEGMY